MSNLLVAGKLHPAGEKLLERLETDGVVHVDYIQEVSEASYAPLIHKADALVIRTQRLSADTIAMATKLKVVSRHGVGYDSVDLNALNARKIALTIVGDVNSVSVAEHSMMQLLAAAKRVLRSDLAVREPDNWEWRNNLEQQEISGKRLLILGYGRIGRHLARMASGFEMEVKAYDPFLEKKGWPEGTVEPISNLNEGLAWADCISVHIPKGDKPAIGADEIARMKAGVIIANTARGGVICEKALADALASGQVGAAGLDVFEQEPPLKGSPLFAYDNAVLSPHTAGLTRECSERMALASIHNAVNYLSGRIDRSLIVNAETIDA